MFSSSNLYLIFPKLFNHYTGATMPHPAFVYADVACLLIQTLNGLMVLPKFLIEWFDGQV